MRSFEASVNSAVMTTDPSILQASLQCSPTRHYHCGRAEKESGIASSSAVHPCLMQSASEHRSVYPMEANSAPLSTIRTPVGTAAYRTGIRSSNVLITDCLNKVHVFPTWVHEVDCLKLKCACQILPCLEAEIHSKCDHLNSDQTYHTAYK